MLKVPEYLKYKGAIQTQINCIEWKYNVPVRAVPMQPGFFADTNGYQIMIDPECPVQVMNWAVPHVFGHVVQWNEVENGKWNRFLGIACSLDVPPELIPAAKEYETEAAQYGASLVLEADTPEVSDLYQCLVKADHDYYFGQIQGVDKPFEVCFKEWQRRPKKDWEIKPKKVPDFLPHIWAKMSERQGVVI